LILRASKKVNDRHVAFLAQAAAAHGLNPEGPFPFQVRGILASYVMHVNAAPTNGPHGMGHLNV